MLNRTAGGTGAAGRAGRAGLPGGCCGDTAAGRRRAGQAPQGSEDASPCAGLGSFSTSSPVRGLPKQLGPRGPGAAPAVLRVLGGQAGACTLGGGRSAGAARAVGSWRAASTWPLRAALPSPTVGSLCLSQDTAPPWRDGRLRLQGGKGKTKQSWQPPASPAAPETAAWQPAATWRPWRGSWPGELPLRSPGECLRLELTANAGSG